jgi:hypothetical protein
MMRIALTILALCGIVASIILADVVALPTLVRGAIIGGLRFAGVQVFFTGFRE